MIYEYKARMTKVVDGDTLRLDIDLGFNHWIMNQTVRLYGIDAPEMDTTEGKAAKAYALEFFGQLNVPVRIRTLKDATEKYGRWLVYVWSLNASGGISSAHSLNEFLVSAGHARPYLAGATWPTLHV